MGDLYELTRRDLFSFGYATTVILLGNPFDAMAQARPSRTQCPSTLSQVKSGAISPKEYSTQRIRCLPELIDAQKSGILKGILYEPTDQELEAVLRDVFSSRDIGEPAIQEFVTANIELYKQLTREGKMATAMPSNIWVFGRKLPQYIVFRQRLFSSPEINNDADVKYVSNHELQHVSDFYHGISLGDVTLSYDTITRRTFRIPFLEQLSELRAEYKVLEGIFKEKLSSGRIPVSRAFYEGTLFRYGIHWHLIDALADTDLEKKVRKLQLEESKGITPEVRGDGFVIRFNLFGKKDSEAVKIPHPPSQ